MNNHTPGPWAAMEPKSDYEGRIFDRSIMAASASGNPIPVARAYNNIGTNCAANARLIAAAPDLLAALEYIIGWKPEAWSSETARDLARAAIDKARGAD